MAALGVVASSSASLLRSAAPLDFGAGASSSAPSSPSFSPSFSSSAAQLNGNLANLKCKRRSAPFDLRPSALPRIAAPLDFVASSSSSPSPSSFSSSAAQLIGNVANFKCKQRIAPLDKRPQTFSNFVASSSSFFSAGTELSGNVADFKCKQRRAPLDKRPQAFSNFLASSFFSASSPSSSFSVSSPSSSFSASSSSSSFLSSSFPSSFFSAQCKRRNAALERGAAAQLSGNAEERGVAGRKWQQNAVLAEESVRERAEDAEEGTSTSQEVIDAEAQLFVQTYARAPLVFVAGQGCWLTDAEGKKYLDMTAGIAVNALGHGDPAWVRAVTEQAATLTHVSNLYHTVPQVKLAERLVNSSFADRVFFANSGTEANEAAIKFSRKYQRTVHGSETEKTELIAFNNGFHGRTLGALALTSKIQYRAPFEPLMPGVTFIEFGDLEAVAQVVKGSGNVAAIFVEPVQGEGGVYPAVESFLKGLRNLCDETGTLLVFDEIQCGLARTGTLWAHEPYGVEPDLMTLAKPLAGGLPIGAVLVTNAVASAVAYGDHGSTFAGGPLVCTAALAVMDRLQEPGFLQSVEAKGQYLVKRLTEELIGKNQHVKEIRGAGLLVGIQLDVSANPVVLAAREEGMILITAGKGDVIRLAPPLVIAEKELDHAVNILVKCLDGL